jgi:hypothetical protein
MQLRVSSAEAGVPSIPFEKSHPMGWNALPRPRRISAQQIGAALIYY